ncbi:MAG: hypothetical protein Hyperionvirus23_3 [Hyperionvirus sp.]|uniref:Amine oxidase domain-containing protein n=1 Tax=Hyperionvirus sp. TaxID=2487770 RepID=A0A3G5AAT1_9VIRU|nr:MAG: hypothetical protein Hyperionvirus23_3 [Hyperionvirus sp.]
MQYVIVGAGITGLYFAFRLKKMGITDYIILEQNDSIGGRMASTDFHGTRVNLGASIIGEGNRHLLGLCKELDIELNDSYSDYELLFKGGDKEWFNNKVEEMYDIFNAENKDEPDESMIDFLQKHLSKDDLVRYVEHIEFYDYLTASKRCTFESYPVDDMYFGRYMYHTIKGGWDVLIKKLLEKVDVRKVLLKKKVMEITYEDGSYKIIANGDVYHSLKLVFATDITFREIKLNGFELPGFTKYMGSMDYVRLYTYHRKHNLGGAVIGRNYLRKMIPVNENIIMSAYNDNIFAKKLVSELKKSGDNVKIINELIYDFHGGKYDIAPIESEKDFLISYWDHGSHFYKPGYGWGKSYFVNDMKNMIICGEMISKRQGYVEGGVQSVDDFWIKKYRFV